MMNNVYHEVPQFGSSRMQWPPRPPRPPSRDSAIDIDKTILHVEAAAVGIQREGRERAYWNTNLFECYKDFSSCFKTMLCPCIAAAENVEIITEGKTSDGEAMIFLAVTSLFCLPWLYTFCIRKTIRKKFNINGSFCTDCLTHMLCFYCAVCQEYREIDSQGFDPKLGWYENIERQKNAVAVYSITPLETEMMTRV